MTCIEYVEISDILSYTHTLTKTSTDSYGSCSSENGQWPGGQMYRLGPLQISNIFLMAQYYACSNKWMGSL